MQCTALYNNLISQYHLKALHCWYRDECRHWDFNRGWDTKHSRSYNHFSAIIWKELKGFGIWAQTCSKRNKCYVAMRAEGANVQGQNSANVLGPNGCMDHTWAQSTLKNNLKGSQSSLLCDNYDYYD